MSNFSNILQSSRLLTLSKNTAKVGRATQLYRHAKYVPTHQVIRTTPASLFRKDFGLKAAMPPRSKTPYITLDALDSKCGMTDFEPGSSFYLNLKRFRDTGAGVKGSYLEEKQTAITLERMKPQQIQEIIEKVPSLKEEFNEFLLKKSALESTKASRRNIKKSQVFEFLNIQEQSQITKDQTVLGNAGFSYVLSGALKNTPKQVTNSKAIYGRSVHSRNNDSLVAVAGFIASPFRKVFRNMRGSDSEVFDLCVEEANISQDGSVSLGVDFNEFNRKQQRTVGHVRGSSSNFLAAQSFSDAMKN